MQVVKKNLLSIIFGVIAILAVVSWFYPVSGMYDDLQTTKLKPEADQYAKLAGLLSKKRALPVMPAVGDSDKSDQFLRVFPNQAIIDAGTQAVESVKTAVNGGIDPRTHAPIIGLVEVVEKANRHELLDQRVLPDVDNGTGYDFKAKYNEQFEKVIPTLLASTTPPTPAEIKKAGDDLWTNTYNSQIWTMKNGGGNAEQINADWKEACTRLPMQMRDDRADHYKMYLLPDALSQNPAMSQEVTSPPSPQEVWYAQLSLWVEMDAINAIAEANQSAHNVKDAPVKQLVKLDVHQDYTIYLTHQNLEPNQGPVGKPDATPAPGGPDFRLSPTGRVSNNLYDVTRFTLVLDVDATRLPQVLADLERDKLVTIYQVDAASVDGKTELDYGFVFGSAPVIQVTLQGEALFLRSWIDKMMPPSVLADVHPDSATGGAAGPGGPGGGHPGMPGHEGGFPGRPRIP